MDSSAKKKLTLFVSYLVQILVSDSEFNRLIQRELLNGNTERLKMLAEDAVRYTFSTVGIAISITSIVLVAGFMVLSLSHFSMNSEMGLLTTITIAL